MTVSRIIFDPEKEKSAAPDTCVVCGLGSLGQYCVVNLKAFGIRVIGIDLNRPQHWEVRQLDTLLDGLILDDARNRDVLERAGVTQARAVLAVTNDERVNIQIAFAARLLSPQVRLVIRSAKQNLTELLGHELHNFVAYEPTQISAAAFALAALGEDIIGFFRVGEQLFQVHRRVISPQDPWANRRSLHELYSRSRKVLGYQSVTRPTPPDELYLFRWDPETLVYPGDTLITVELQSATRLSPVRTPATRPTTRWQWPEWLRWRNWQERFKTWWDKGGTHRVALVVAGLMLTLLVTGTVLYDLYYPELQFPDTFYTTMILLLGGFGDVFGGLGRFELPLPWWLRLLSLGLTLTGIAFTGVIYALLTEKLLATQFEFLQRRPPVPPQGHVVIVGSGRVGQRVAGLLQEFRQPLAVLTSQEVGNEVLPQLPVLSGPLLTLLPKANLATAKSIVTVTDDELENLEIALRARETNIHSHLVIRTYDPLFSENVRRLFPFAQVLCANELAAEAFAAAAFGENILGLFRLEGRTILVVEYRIEAGDTLDGLILAQVAYGYGVVPVYYYSQQDQEARTMPSDDLRLHPGDQLVVLATSRALQRVERGERLPPRYQVRVEKALSREALFYGGNVIAQVTGFDLKRCRDVMEQLPCLLPEPIYRHQAQRLVRELAKVQVTSRLIPPPPER
ncbi:MAG: NAD-binding protein [Gloeomargarita sp. SKYBB_i_bin120]|nr:NAD-binding protein [Gloeomargarita sp. SKYB120]MDW8177130.1 NAD-binding protein [Gloeomargarita sp. SKYBB_i_bin120]